MPQPRPTVAQAVLAAINSTDTAQHSAAVAATLAATRAEMTHQATAAVLEAYAQYVARPETNASPRDKYATVLAALARGEELPPDVIVEAALSQRWMDAPSTFLPLMTIPTQDLKELLATLAADDVKHWRSLAVRAMDGFTSQDPAPSAPSLALSGRAPGPERTAPVRPAHAG